MEHAAWLNDAIVFLVAAGIVVPFFQRFRIGAVLGFLLVGVVVGPFGLGRFTPQADWVRLISIEDPENVAPFAEWGVIFLLFLLGLESSANKLWELRRYVFGVGALQLTLSAAALAAGLSLLGGAPNGAAVLLGLCFALSSTAIVMQILIDSHRVATLTGRVALAVLLFQDLMVVPILFIADMLGDSSGFSPLRLALTIGQAVLAVGTIIVVGRFVLRPVLRAAAATGSRDLIMAVTLLIVISAAGATGVAGLSTALGAFLAGLLLSESEYRHQIEIDLEPFKGLLLGLFFMTVGMTLDPAALLSDVLTIVLGLVGLIIIKAVAFTLAGWLMRVERPVTAELALLLAQAGEFAFVVIGIARASGVIPPELANTTLAIAALSMMVTPLLAMAARRLGSRAEAKSHPASLRGNIPGEFEDHVIIGGFGRVGQMIAELLEKENVPYVALDSDGHLVNQHRDKRGHLFFGDASRPEMLRRSGAHQARAFVVTLNSEAESERMAHTILRLRPDALVIARARDADHAMRLAKIGVTAVVPEAVEASLQLASRLLECLGLPDEAVDLRIEAARQQVLEKLRVPSEA